MCSGSRYMLTNVGYTCCLTLYLVFSCFELLDWGYDAFRYAESVRNSKPAEYGRIQQMLKGIGSQS